MKILVALSMLTLALAGCSGNGSTDGCGEQNENGEYVVCMVAGDKFSPAQLTVPVGSTVVWELQAGTHNVHLDGDLYQSNVSSTKGENGRYIFTEAGEFGYQCDPHAFSGMKGSITVTA